MNNTNSVMNTVIGVLSVFVGHVVISALMFGIGFLIAEFAPQSQELLIFFLFAFFGIGITQLLYVIPLALWARSKGRYDTMKGVIIAAVITLLLNGGCFLLLTTGLGF